MAIKWNEKEMAAQIGICKERFEKYKERHKGIIWEKVAKKLASNPGVCQVLLAMERTGGEPDVVRHDPKTDTYTFMDCAVESPKDRRSWCYDREALNKRKENKPANDAMTAMETMGAEMLDDEDYHYLQTLGAFDLKTSSWILTPPAIRKLGGALFCDRRYDKVFTYHNGAESYYAARGVRGKIRV